MRHALAARRYAAVLLILAAVLWWHRWAPALIVVAFVLWVILHKRLEREHAEGRQPAWRRAWPPAPLVLVVLIAGGIALYSASNDALGAKLLPVALNALAALLVVRGIWKDLTPEARAASARESAAPAPAA